jgi:hypothetical protein
VEAWLFGRFRTSRLHYREITEIEVQPLNTPDEVLSLVDGKAAGPVRVVDLAGGNHYFFPADREKFMRVLQARVDAYRKVYRPIFGGLPLRG